LLPSIIISKKSLKDDRPTAVKTLIHIQKGNCRDIRKMLKNRFAEKSRGYETQFYMGNSHKTVSKLSSRKDPSTSIILDKLRNNVNFQRGNNEFREIKRIY